MLGNHLPHICIDARFSGAARTRGIGRYVELLLEGLARSASLPFRVTLLVLPETQIAEDTIKEKILKRVESLREQNPMLGHRGCRLIITYPEITEMQTRAIIEAAVEVMKEKKTNYEFDLEKASKELFFKNKEVSSVASS